MKKVLVVLIFAMLLGLTACELDVPTTANKKPAATRPGTSVTQSAPEMTEPTTMPTEPTDAPTQPTTKPTEPTTPPSEPTTAPTEPVAPPHTHDYKTVVTKPTCTEEGYTTYTCDCGDTFQDDLAQALGHQWKEATCTEAKICSVCYKSEGSAKGHDFMEGTCVQCGAEDPNYKPEKDLETILDELENTIETDVDKTIGALQTEWEKLKTEVTTYELYVSNLEKIEVFYEKVYNTTNQLCVRMYDYALLYAEVVMSSEATFIDKYDYLEDIYDNVYNGIGDDIYDEIYNGILDEMYDAFYNGVISDAYDYIPYAVWSEIHSQEYSMWSDTHSDVYRTNSDACTDVYRFASDIRGELYARDQEGAEKSLQRFKAKIARLKGEDGNTYQSNPALVNVATIEALELLVENDVDKTINEIVAEWEMLKNEIDTYEKYVANVDRIEAFYYKVHILTNNLLLRQYEYAIVYTKMIMDSDMSAKDKYGAMEDLYDCIYKKTCDKIEEEIYDDLLGDMESTFYDGIIKKAEDDVKYSEWYDIRSNEYEMWYHTRSDIYSDWYNTRSDIYGFYYDIRSELYGKDIEGAMKDLLVFEKRFLRLTKQETGNGGN